MYEIIIVGAGPSGMTAAVYAARKKINTLLLAKEIGGQVVTTRGIENYMGYQYVEGFDLMDKFEQQLKKFPISRQDGEEVALVTQLDGAFEAKSASGEEFQAKAVIIATGKKPRRLDVGGEKELTGRGVSYCSVCDAPLFADEDVAVIGGGNSALEAIDDLLKIATKVYSIADLGFTGDAILVDRVTANPKLTLYHGHQVVEILGTERVEGIVIRDTRRVENRKLAVRGVFVEIGMSPNSSLVKGLAALNSQGEIEVNCKCETNVEGLFAAGDVASTPEKQIIIAAGEGAKAALQAHRYLQRL